ncbi:MAG: NAD(P)-dependent oxidoreductase [Candidatus Gracilibacteria bacterium]|jgi:UDP-glucose 4-epimerase
MIYHPLRICITGTKGFIGSHFLRHLSGNPNVEIFPFEGDLLCKNDLREFFDQHPNIDQIIHLVGIFEADFQRLLDINISTTYFLLNAAVHHKIPKIIYVSSGAVYGEPLGKASKEKDSLHPNTLYGLAKKMSEEIIFYHHRNFGLSYVILRFPNVYGPNNNKGVIYRFKTDIQKKKEITIHGDGSQLRNFLHVKDACLALEKSIFYPKSDVFNISNPKSVSLNEIVETLQKKEHFKVRYEPEDNSLRNLSLDIKKAQKKLHFSPTITELDL